MTRQIVNQQYRQKPLNSNTVVKIAATYEDNPVTAAQKRLTRIARSAALSLSGTFVFMTNHDTDRG